MGPSVVEASLLRRALCWGVHLLTASGAVVGVWAILRIGVGDFQSAAILMLIAMAIDAIDGTLARAAGVSQVLPYIDGRRLDDMVDYLNFVIVPAVFLVATGALLHLEWIVLPLVGSAYGFSRTDAKTDDDFFLGFPSYWNIVALYIWQLELSPMAGTLWVGGLSLACFVPMKFLYPTKMKVLRGPTMVGGILWGGLFGWAILAPETARRFHLVEISLLYVAYYWALSFVLGGWQRRSPAQGAR